MNIPEILQSIRYGESPKRLSSPTLNPVQQSWFEDICLDDLIKLETGLAIMNTFGYYPKEFRVKLPEFEQQNDWEAPEHRERFLSRASVRALTVARLGTHADDDRTEKKVVTKEFDERMSWAIELDSDNDYRVKFAYDGSEDIDSRPKSKHYHLVQGCDIDYSRHIPV